jgi:hypothetical protein
VVKSSASIQGHGGYKNTKLNRGHVSDDLELEENEMKTRNFVEDEDCDDRYVSRFRVC